MRGDNVVQGSVRWENAKRWPESETDGLEKYWLEAGDVILAMDRPWIEAGLKYCAVSEADLPCLLVQRVSRLRGKENLHTKYLRYVIGSSSFTEYVLGVQTGSAVPHISAGQIKDFQFLLPEYAEQEAIAETLGALDDKIEVNRRMNGTLEAMARAVFRDWFVDFGPTRRQMAGASDPHAILGGLIQNPEEAHRLAPLFPATLGDEGLPEGWEETSFDRVAQHHKATLKPMDTPDEMFHHFSLPAYDKNQSPALDSGESIKSNKTLIPPEAVLLSKLNPEIPRVWLVPSSSDRRQVSSTEFLPHTAKPPFGRAYLFSMFSEQTFRQTLAGMVTGTSKSHQRISPKALAKLRILRPDDTCVSAFEDVVSPMLEKTLQAISENRTLAATRDLLLPKLMSGEIRLRDAEAMA